MAVLLPRIKPTDTTKITSKFAEIEPMAIFCSKVL